MNDDSARVTGTSNVEHSNATGLADFLAGWRKGFERIPWLTVTLAVVGLTNFGEKPVPSTRLAEALGRSVSEAEALARQWGPPGTRVEDGLISHYPERAKSAARRQVQVGERRFGLTGCGPDIFEYASLARPSLHLDETCTTTGTPIRIVFTPSSVERVEPSGAVLRCPTRRTSPRSRRPATSRRSTPLYVRRRPSSPPPRRLEDGWLIIPAAVSSPSGRRGS